jgi:hypothetical protein
MRKIKIKLTSNEVQCFSDLLYSSGPSHATTKEKNKITLLILATIGELHQRIHTRSWYVVNGKPITITLKMSEALAIDFSLPLLKIPANRPDVEAVRYKILSTIEPQLP